MSILKLTTNNENIFSHNEAIVPFVVSLSNHERDRYNRSPFDRLRANGKKVIFRAKTPDRLWMITSTESIKSI
jgi:hypothetical protein